MSETTTIPGALLLCLDMQGPFVGAVEGPAEVTRRCALALRAARGVGIATVLTEQAPEKLGPTIPEIASAAGDAPVLTKSTFSALATPAVAELIEELEIEHLLICGIETSICVYQTALEALNRDLAVTVLSDAVSARRPADAATALTALRGHGVHVLPLESVFYALLHDTSHPFFKSFTQLVKSHA
ncbi:isochorismatase family protein [Actomonas aquatica]|uniref:Isochorismatase family protein n=1 Tax=Actomonas aquatica TaxID=2866162 RepID=A0ABZ1C8M3_9BACT|nr:isochorismatase family protein [Opitutus sp. WL0086]WRQ88047.1 isochorismatase family protein [Opitutus sp. WL0086]